jgi:hypothetical protein
MRYMLSFPVVADIEWISVELSAHSPSILKPDKRATIVARYIEWLKSALHQYVQTSMLHSPYSKRLISWLIV